MSKVVPRSGGHGSVESLDHTSPLEVVQALKAQHDCPSRRHHAELTSPPSMDTRIAVHDFARKGGCHPLLRDLGWRLDASHRPRSGVRRAQEIGAGLLPARPSKQIRKWRPRQDSNLCTRLRR